MYICTLVIGSSVQVLQVAPGKCASVQQVEAALQIHAPAVVLMVHAESSTGVLQPLQEMGKLCHK